MQDDDKSADRFISAISNSLLNAFRKAVRLWSTREENLRDFPWRKTCAPYEVLLAEIMLRRTNAKAVSKVYPNFLKSFPNINSLKRANRADLSVLLEPLGLRWRTENIACLSEQLHFTEELGHDCLPESVKELQNLPGVGPYVARAVAINCWHEKTIAIDVNIARLTCRYFGLKYSDNLRRKKSFQDFLDLIIQDEKVSNVRTFNYALLDISFMFCSLRTPKCTQCPLREHCTWFTKRSNSTPN